jgi:5S rRNA maturation endonuclease (ribonuclease M5)
MKKQIPHSNVKKPIKYQRKTKEILGQVQEILEEYKGKGAFTVRQIYYQLVSKKIIPNTLSSYKRLSWILSNARKDGIIPFNSIIDRMRMPIKENSWDGLGRFIKGMKKKYKKSKWKGQDRYLEIWLEKDALRGLFEPITNMYDVYLVVGRGYPSLSSLYEAAKRFKEANKPIQILYFGDFDPSGENIPQTIKKNLIKHFKIDRKNLRIRKVALTLRDIKKYKLPPAPTKSKDSRSKKFVQKYGDFCVELDALPREVLGEKLKKSIEKYFNYKTFQRRLKAEKKEAKKLEEIIKRLKIK